jgi:hypothetical protein
VTVLPVVGADAVVPLVVTVMVAVPDEAYEETPPEGGSDGPAASLPFGGRLAVMVFPVLMIPIWLLSPADLPSTVALLPIFM